MKRNILLSVCLTLLLVSTVFAQKRAFTIEDLDRLKSISDLQLSPDGNSILYAVGTPDLPRAKRVNSLWIMNLDGRNARQLIAQGAFGAQFTPDGKSVAFFAQKNGEMNLY